MIGRLQGRMAGPEEMAGWWRSCCPTTLPWSTAPHWLADGGTLAALW